MVARGLITMLVALLARAVRHLLGLQLVGLVRWVTAFVGEDDSHGGTMQLKLHHES